MIQKPESSLTFPQEFQNIQETNNVQFRDAVGITTCRRMYDKPVEASRKYTNALSNPGVWKKKTIFYETDQDKFSSKEDIIRL